MTNSAEHLFMSSFAIGFSSGSDGKESACNVGDLGLIPGLGRYPEEGNGYPLQCSLVGYSPVGRKRVGHSWMTKQYA